MESERKLMLGLAYCDNENELGAINCGNCPYDKYKEGSDISQCTSHLCRDARAKMKEQKGTIEKQQAEIKALKELVKKKNRKIRNLMDDNYINGGR